MRRTLRFAPCLLAAACAGGGPAAAALVPDWSGPAVHGRHLGDGGLEVELVAPTAGHAFELRLVESSGERADLHFVHRTSGDAFVAQIVTPLRVTVPGTRLGASRSVCVWIATEVPGASPSREKLAMALARP